MSSHTKGPWKAVHYSETALAEGTAYNFGWVIQSETQSIAQTDGVIPDAEDAANARILAAAADMFEALEPFRHLNDRLAATLSDDAYVGGGVTYGHLRAAAAAWAKAKGEA